MIAYDNHMLGNGGHRTASVQRETVKGGDLENSIDHKSADKITLCLNVDRMLRHKTFEF